MMTIFQCHRNPFSMPLRPTHIVLRIFKLLLVTQSSWWLAAAQKPFSVPSLPPPPPPSDSFAYNPNFSPFMAIIMVIVVSVIFILGFVVAYIRRRHAGPSATGIIGGWTILRVGRRYTEARGVDAEVIESFPTFVYSSVKGLKTGNVPLECAVCLNEFEDEETLRLIPKCNHVFHTHCIDVWLSSHTTCPVCRANLNFKPDEISYNNELFRYPDAEQDEPKWRNNADELNRRNNVDEPLDQVSIRVEEESTNLIGPNKETNQYRPSRSRSTGFQFTGIFSRSHTTGHSLVQPEDDHERFTLTLPENIQNQIMNLSLNRSNSCMVFPRAQSSRMSYRTGHDKKHNFNYNRFNNNNG